MNTIEDGAETPQVLASAVFWTESTEVRNLLRDLKVGRSVERDGMTGILVAHANLEIADAIARQAEFEKFLHTILENLRGFDTELDGRRAEIPGELAIHVSLSGPETARGILFDSESLALLGGFRPSIYFD